MARIRGCIYQFIKWEEKEKFFSNMDYGDKPCDLIHIGEISNKSAWRIVWNRLWYGGFFGLFKSYILKKDKPIWSKDFLYDNGMPIWIERPHNFKEGDIVNIDIKISKGDGE